MDFSKVELETAHCLCGSSKPPSRTVTCRDEVSALTFHYERCPDCGLDVLNPRPTASDIGPFYPTTYHAYQTGYGDREKLRRWFERLVYKTYYVAIADRPLWMTILWPLLALVLFPLRHWPVLAFPQPKLKHVFELGAAAGMDLMSFRAAGWQTSGCEPSRQACDVAAARGFSVQCCMAEDAVMAEDAYTCVFMNNVFEHLYNPTAVLQKAHAGLKAGGHLILVVPNHASWSAGWLRGYWAGYDGPRHIYGYSPRTLRKILGEQGFQVVYIQHRPAIRWLWSRTANAWLAAHNVRGRKRAWVAGLFSILVVPFALLSSVSRRADFIKVVARKENVRPTPSHDAQLAVAVGSAGEGRWN